MTRSRMNVRSVCGTSSDGAHDERARVTRSHSSMRAVTPVSSTRSARIFTAPCAWRRRPSGSRDPVGVAPSPDIAATETGLSVSDATAHVAESLPRKLVHGCAAGDGGGAAYADNGAERAPREA